MKYALSDFTLAIEMAMRYEPTKDFSLRSVTVFCNRKNPKTNRIRVAPHGKGMFVVTYGKPNYRERKFLALCKKAKALPKKTYIMERRTKKK